MALTPLDEGQLEAIGRELGTEFRPEPYLLPNGRVFAAELCPAGKERLRLVVWPSLRRVDAYSGQCCVVFKEIEGYEIIPGVEVVFRRKDGGHLFVTAKATVNVAV